MKQGNQTKPETHKPADDKREARAYGDDFEWRYHHWFRGIGFWQCYFCGYIDADNK